MSLQPIQRAKHRNRSVVADSSRPRPFVKWAGGKTQLLPDLLARLPKSFRRYHEPFVGGGALFFALAGERLLREAYLSDANQPLIDTYLGLQQEIEKVIARLKRHRHERGYFYRIRAQNPNRLTLASRAARIIYLNKTCYNGLYRENRSGQFNVPFGRMLSPTICDEPNLRAVAAALQGVEVECRHYSTVLEKAERGDFIYFDPPYHPLSPTSSFTSYHRNGFGAEDQAQLRDTFGKLDKRGAKVMLSNSSADLIKRLYKGFHVEEVRASRAINSKANRRGKVTELIIRNYR